jgi:hypothetical protein
VSPPPEPPSGWQRRFVADAERANEMSEVYRLAGFDVRIAPATPDDFSESCTACWLVQSGLFRVVYTRRLQGAAP